ncbi:2OG-Fe dioxygenase family protein [Photobacterium sanguinicancri]|uniref:2OG-Fe dioxygenase family protein n=1 Tax=Photobacterium sanguinicancri TaxID=875932 RepID=A0AAW7Y6Q4_9GAMM|nr:2OG-Fe dioxygenase family protein [Photobacterium sanguinicancri]MDO6544044.1 2OG-Fe dioxygenase family protein [Photobacterium sanguinicancri]
MNATLERTLQLTQLSGKAVNDLSSSFHDLPKTKHADGQYRLRRYSIVKVRDTGIVHLAAREFVQSDDINTFQGNVSRSFEVIEDAVINSQGMFEMCRVFRDANHLSAEHEIEIHQMRIATSEDETQVAPEGVHQDGFQHIAVIGIDRHNIEGGDFLVYREKNAQPFLSMALQQGEVAILADNQLWHNARPIKAVKKDHQAYMDVFVLTAKGAGV